MDLLPSETIIEIFSYLQCNDLTSLTVTCKRFSKIIANSQRMMENFFLRITEENMSDLKFLSRKYSKARMDIPILQKFHDIPLSLTECIKVLEVKELHLLDLNKLLFCCKNLKELTLENIKTSENAIESIHNFPTLHLETLKIKTDFRALELLNTSTVKKLIICNYNLMEEKITQNTDYYYFVLRDVVLFNSPPFNFYEKSLEELTFDDCIFYEDILEKLLVRNGAKLKVLRFIDTKMTEECKEILKAYKETYERLDVQNDGVKNKANIILV